MLCPVFVKIDLRINSIQVRHALSRELLCFTSSLSAWWSASSLSAATAESLTTWTAPQQHSEWKEEGNTVSDRSSRKSGQEITHRAAGWQHRGQCCPVVPMVDRGRGDPRNIPGVIIDKNENDFYTIATRSVSCLISTHELISLFALNSCWRTVTLTGMYTVSGKKSLQYFMCNFNKLKVIFIIFGTNHPKTPLY